MSCPSQQIFNLDIDIVQGSEFKLAIQPTNDDNSILSLADATFEAHLKYRYRDDVPLVFMSVSDYSSIDANYPVLLTIVSQDTCKIERNGVWDVLYKTPDSDKQLLIRGRFNLHRSAF